MKWTTEKRKVNDLIPYDKNPRQMSDKQNKDLTESLKKFDLVEIPAVNKDGTILAGHQRLRIMQSLGRGDEEIDVRVPDRQLSEKDVQEYNIRSNKNTGEWNFDELANSFEVDDLLEWGFDEKDFAIGDAFDPVGIDEQGRLDEKKKVICPKCGEEFEPK
jgi:ParB-like chromosome segregation protein Spo0J